MNLNAQPRTPVPLAPWYFLASPVMQILMCTTPGVKESSMSSIEAVLLNCLYVEPVARSRFTCHTSHQTNQRSQQNLFL